MEGNTNDRTTKFNVCTYINDNTHGLQCRVVDHMPMARRFVLLVLFTLFLSFSSNDVGCKRIYREDHLELKRQHKLLNKLAKKTIRVRSIFPFVYVYIYLC